MNATRILLYLCAVSLLTGAGCHKRPATGPARLVCQEPVYDFGTRSSVDIIDHGFVVKNMGDAPLRIKRVRSSCLCSVGELPKDALAPRDETTVRVRMHLCGSRGHVNREFLVESNDPYNPQTILSVTGTVVRRVEVRPCEVSFLGIYGDTKTCRTVTIEVIDPNVVLNIVQFDSDSPYFRPEVEVSKKGKSYVLSIETVPPLPEGVARGTICLVTDSERHKTIEIPVKADVFGKLVVFPREIILAADDGRQLNPSHISILPGKIDAFELKAIIPPTPSITTKITPLPAGGYVVDLTVSDVTDDLDGRQLRILTDVEGLEEVLMPIRVLPGD
jgi:hypothetical protein